MQLKEIPEKIIKFIRVQWEKLFSDSNEETKLSHKPV